MPLTVITLKNVPPSLRGDLTKWMQEIATGVFIGNFNSRVREQLWRRVQDNVGTGEATLSYAYRNEIGYQFDTTNAAREVVDFDGIPLVCLPSSESQPSSQLGYSDVAKFRKIKKFSAAQGTRTNFSSNYVVLDIETDGLDEDNHTIIEIGAVKVYYDQIEEFHYLLKYDKVLPREITRLTGITNEVLSQEGVSIEIVLPELLAFIENLPIVGYGIHFDLAFLNKKLFEFGLPLLPNPIHDIIKDVKSEKLFLDNYKLQTVLKAYEIEAEVLHRALLDARLIYELSTKVNKFLQRINRK